MDLPYGSNGYLIQGIYKIDINTFIEKFVDSYPNSNTREKIFAGYCDYCKFLSSFNFVKRQWINGSYITKKIDPNDIDIVFFVDSRAFNSNESLISYIKTLETDYDYVCTKYSCDTHFVTEYPEDDIRYLMYKESAAYWSDVKKGVYSTDKYGVAKGMVELEFIPSYFEVKTDNVVGGVVDDK